MADSDFPRFAPEYPVDGSRITGAEIREMFGAVAEHHRVSALSGVSVPASVTGDRFFGHPSNADGVSTVDLTGAYNLDITIDGSNNVVDISATAANIAAVTLDEVVSAINTAFGQTVAFAFAGYPLLVSPTRGPASTIVLAVASTNDGLEAVFDLEGHGRNRLRDLADYGPPWSFTGQNPDDGWVANLAPNGNEGLNHDFRYRNLAAAKIQGGGVTFPVDLSPRNRIRLEVDGTTQTITVGVSGSALADIVSDINSAWGSTIAYDVGSQLQIRSPTTGPTSSVSVLPAEENDAAPLILGIQSGFLRLDEYDDPVTGTEFTQEHHGGPGNFYTAAAPRNELGTDFVPLLRDTERYPGVGLWGPHVDSQALLPSTGLALGEVRIARDTGIPWGWGIRGSLASWTRAVPGAYRHIEYLSERESYRLRHARDYNPVPLVANRVTPITYSRYMDGGTSRAVIQTGDVPELVDARDERWAGVFSPATNVFATHGTAARTLGRDRTWREDFQDQTVGSALGNSPEGVSWFQLGGSVEAGLDGTDRYATLLPTAGLADGALYQGPTSTDGRLTDSGTPTGNMDVCAEVLQEVDDQSLPPAADSAVAVGVIARATYQVWSSWYMAEVDKGGTVVLRKVTGGAFNGGVVASLATGMHPSRAHGQVLRLRVNGSTLEAYWPSSTDPTRWRDETPALTYVDGSPLSGTYSGLFFRNVNGSGTAMRVHKFTARPITTVAALPGLPEVSGARLRDTIGAVRVGPFTTPNSGTITDCTPEFPFLLAEGFCIVMRQDTAGRAIEIGVDPDCFLDDGGGGIGDGDIDGTGDEWELPIDGGSNPNAPAPLAGTLRVGVGLGVSSLWHQTNTGLDSQGNPANPRLIMEAVDPSWNTTYLQRLNLRPTNWEASEPALRIQDLTTLNSAIYTRQGLSAPADITGVGGNFGPAWTVGTYSQAIGRAAAAAASKYTGLPGWLSSVVGTRLDPGLPYTGTFPIQDPLLIDSVATSGALPTLAGGGFVLGQSPPEGLLAIVRNSGSPQLWSYRGVVQDDWAQVSGGSGTTDYWADILTPGGGDAQLTLEVGGGAQSFSVIAGAGIEVSGDDALKQIVITNTNAGGGAGTLRDVYQDGNLVLSDAVNLDFRDGFLVTSDAGAFARIQAPWAASGSVLYNRDQSLSVAIGGVDVTAPFYVRDSDGAVEVHTRQVISPDPTLLGGISGIKSVIEQEPGDSIALRIAAQTNISAGFEVLNSDRRWRTIIRPGGSYALRDMTAGSDALQFDTSQAATFFGPVTVPALTVTTINGIDPVNLFDRTTHTADDITAGTTNLFFTAVEQTKLAGIEPLSQANPEAQLDGVCQEDRVTAFNFSTDFTVVGDGLGTATIGLSAAGGGAPTVEDDGVPVSGAPFSIWDFEGFAISDQGGGRGRFAIDFGFGMVFNPDQWEVRAGATVSDLALGSHVHGAAGYSQVPWATGISGIPSTFPPSPHDLTAGHTGTLLADRVLANSAFADGTTYRIGKTTPTGISLFVGHNGSVPLVNTFQIADHSHSTVAGSGGQVSYADLSNIPSTFPPADHALGHARGGGDEIQGETVRIDQGASNYTGGNTLGSHLSGIDGALGAIPRFYSFTASSRGTITNVDNSAFLVGQHTAGNPAGTSEGHPVPFACTLQRITVTTTNTLGVGEVLTVFVYNAATGSSVSAEVDSTGRSTSTAVSLAFAVGEELHAYAQSTGLGTSIQPGSVNYHLELAG